MAKKNEKIDITSFELELADLLEKYNVSLRVYDWYLIVDYKSSDVIVFDELEITPKSLRSEKTH